MQPLSPETLIFEPCPDFIVTNQCCDKEKFKKLNWVWNLILIYFKIIVQYVICLICLGGQKNQSCHQCSMFVKTAIFVGNWYSCVYMCINVVVICCHTSSTHHQPNHEVP